MRLVAARLARSLSAAPVDGIGRCALAAPSGSEVNEAAFKSLAHAGFTMPSLSRGFAAEPAVATSEASGRVTQASQNCCSSLQIFVPDFQVCLPESSLGSIQPVPIISMSMAFLPTSGPRSSSNSGECTLGRWVQY